MICKTIELCEFDCEFDQNRHTGARVRMICPGIFTYDTTIALYTARN